MSNATLSHTMKLTRYWTSRYYARLSFHDAESGSLKLCTTHFLLLPSDPAVTSSALAIRIIFPLVGVMPACRRLGLPAMPGKHKKAPGSSVKIRGLKCSGVTCQNTWTLGFPLEWRVRCLLNAWVISCSFRVILSAPALLNPKG